MALANDLGKDIYTLAQNRTGNFEYLITRKEVTGTGTPLKDNPALLKRANKKVITNALVLSMIDVAREYGDTEFIQPYWNTYHCQSKLITHNGRSYTDYCKNRWCTTCAGIRKAYILNRYYPTISQWPEPHLLTLTLKAVNAKELPKTIKEMKKCFSKIINRQRKRNQRSNPFLLKCIKSLECNFNASALSYNPHFHLITPDRRTAVFLRQEWIKELKKVKIGVSELGQHLRKVENTEGDLVEVIKYGAKILSDPDPANKRKRKKGDLAGLQIYARGLHTIYKAFKGTRLFGSIGFKLPKEATNTDTAFKTVSDYEEWHYQPQVMDWVNTDTGQLLTEYEIDPYLKYILKTQIDKELC